ncbi:hypothetical protein GCM10010430_27250 [Kitasatospora cystarginea]|uniref:Uncharacterized protein n=1 Tax=Kitasatospora cystarginea TaxID=58350 RepID=A0ABN3DXU5_9ACTN
MVPARVDGEKYTVPVGEVFGERCETVGARPAVQEQDRRAVSALAYRQCRAVAQE